MEIEIDDEFDVECPLCEGAGVIKEIDEYISLKDPVDCFLCQGDGEILVPVTGTIEVDPSEFANEGHL